MVLYLIRHSLKNSSHFFFTPSHNYLKFIPEVFIWLTISKFCSLLLTLNNIGRLYLIIKVVAANTLTIAGSGAEWINNANTQTITAQYGKIVVQSNGTQWFIIG